MNTCENCGKQEELYSGIKNGQIYHNLCNKCQANFTGGAIYAHAYNRRQDQRKYAKDIIQPYDGLRPSREYIREYPNQAKEMWDEDTLRKYS